MTNVTAEHRKTERENTADFVQMFFLRDQFILSILLIYWILHIFISAQVYIINLTHCAKLASNK